MSKSSKSSKVSNGLILKGFRKQNKFSQAYIGEIVGKNKRTVSSYEVGRINMPSSVISILNKKYKLGLTSTASTTSTSSKTSSKAKSVKKSTKKVSTFSSRFTSFYESTGLNLKTFCSKYGLSPAAVSRVISDVGTHYFSTSQIAALSKDVDFIKLILG